MMYEYKRCRYCGKKFGFFTKDVDDFLRAIDEKKKHLSVCPVRFGIEECPAEWKEILERHNNKIKFYEREIKKLQQDLETGIMSPLLARKAKQLIELKKAEIEVHRRSIDDDYEFEHLPEIKKGDVIIPSFFQD